VPKAADRSTRAHVPEIRAALARVARVTILRGTRHTRGKNQICVNFSSMKSLKSSMP